MLEESAPPPEPWTATRYHWVECDTEAAAFVCRRCGAREAFAVPVDLFAWTSAGRDFLLDHRACKAVAADVVQEQLA